MSDKHQKITLYLGAEASNFREIKGGAIARGILYRSSDPLEGGDLGSAISKLAKRAGIHCVLNLADRDAVLAADAKDVPWYKKLVLEKRVIGLHMDMNILDDHFNQKLKKGLQFMVTHKGPYLIHCFAGVDRTGFVSAILEGLMGANLKDICNDYLASFGSGFTSAYEIDNHENDVHRDEEIKYYGGGIEYIHIEQRIVDQLCRMNKGIAVTDSNMQAAVERYLLEDLGLSKDEIARLITILSGTQILGFDDMKSMNYEERWAILERYSVKELEALMCSEPYSFGATEVENDIVDAIMMTRKRKLNQKFKWTKETIERIVKVSDKFLKAWEDGFCKAKWLLDNLYEQEQDKSKFQDKCQADIMLEPRVLVRNSKTGEYEERDDTIYRALTASLHPSELNMALSYDPAAKSDAGFRSDIFISRDLSWAIEGFGEGFLDDRYICYAIHILYSHNDWAIEDIAMINNILVKVQTTYCDDTMELGV